jgi:hypothetical protein
MFRHLSKGGLGSWRLSCDIPSQMTLHVTLVLAAGFLALALFAGWRGARPPDPMRGPRMIPWRPIMVGSALGLILMLVHVVNLFGVQTGR